MEFSTFYITKKYVKSLRSDDTLISEDLINTSDEDIGAVTKQNE